jgi:probable phosphoglycerate mutase
VNALPRVFLIRHGETEWSLSGQHTGITDIPLTQNGRNVARRLAPVLAKERFALVLSSPRQRSMETARIAGFGDRVQIDPDLAEWDYGEYEGLTTPQIRERVPEWTVFTHPCPGGETAAQVAARADRVLTRARGAGGDVALFSHGHMGRVLGARWLGLPPADGRHFLLGTATLNVLGHERTTPAIAIWNAPLP